MLYGYNTPFGDSTLDSLYGNPLDYFGKLVLDSDALVTQGFWLTPDAQAVVRKARNADVP